MSITLCVLLWAVPGNEQLLIEYEDRVLPRLAEYGAELRQRVRSNERDAGPFEVQLIEFPSEDELDRYLADPERAALADLRNRAVAQTQVLRVDVVHG